MVADPLPIERKASLNPILGDQIFSGLSNQDLLLAPEDMAIVGELRLCGSFNIVARAYPPCLEILEISRSLV